jgi:DNA-directed RNA polymerase specialized sigma24 family protein
VSNATHLSDDSEGANGPGWRRDQERQDAELLVALRRCDARAYEAFARRFTGVLLDQAQRLGIDPSDRETVVTEFLDDMVIRLATRESPRLLGYFVVVAFRNRVLDARRAAKRRAASTDADADAVLHASCSAYTMQVADGPSDAELHSTAARDLIARVVAGCSESERQLLLWSAHHVPLREAAGWIGISHAAVRQRIVRLRARLIRDTARHLDALEPAERLRVTALLRRAGVNITTIDPGMRHEAP